MTERSKLSILTNGIIKENPVLVLIIGTCPFLATSTSALNGLGMGLSTTAVLVCSNIVISILKNIIPNRVRIPCYITVIAGFVTIVQFLLKAYLPSLNASLGIYIPLIVVNCIILGRAEMFANKNSVVDSALDGIGMGLGFTLALFIMGMIREFIGAGTFLGMEVTANLIDPMTILTMAPGGFFVFGVLTAVINKITKGKVNRNFDESICPGTPENLALAEEAAAKEKAAKLEAAKKAAEAKKAEAAKAEAAKTAAAEKEALEKAAEKLETKAAEGAEKPQESAAVNAEKLRATILEKLQKGAENAEGGDK
ncbi:MAG: electron transport complex subunit E [Firmicutes bacterium]|nr:electron transport complex subunit E [Bacillota bacterium]